MACSSCAILLFLFLSTCAALNVQFQEDDITVSEDDGYLELGVTMEDSLDTDVTVEIVPKTVKQHTASRGKLVHDFLNIDPAEEDLDYNSSTITISLKRGHRQTKMAAIAIFNDLITETEEVFIVELRIVEVSPPKNRDTIFSNRNTTIVRITPSMKDHTLINITAKKSRFNESDGNVSDALFIELNRPIEANITLQLLQSSSAAFQNVDDFRLPNEIVVPSKTLRMNVPFEIIDDDVAEEDETITVSIKYQRTRLYSIIHNMANIFIRNNDIPRIGFSLNGTATSFLRMTEGESLSFCVTLLEPQVLYQLHPLQLSNSTRSTDFILNDTRNTNSFILLSPNTQQCFTIITLDNNFENSDRNIIFNIISMYGMRSDILFEPSSLKIELVDNDGAPMMPKGVFLNKTNTNLFISWTVTLNKYKPIEKFVVIVTTEDSPTQLISRRQTFQTYEEYETNNTFYVISIRETTLYNIQICASNKNKRNCSKEVILKPTQITSKNDDVSVAPPVLAALAHREEGLGEMGKIAVIVGPSVAFALSILLILTVLFCKFWGERRHYYPSHQEKILMASKLQMKHYYRQRSSTSSVSTDWTLTSPSSYCTPSPKSTLQKSFTLGTPV